MVSTQLSNLAVRISRQHVQNPTGKLTSIVCTFYTLKYSTLSPTFPAQMSLDDTGSAFVWPVSRAY